MPAIATLQALVDLLASHHDRLALITLERDDQTTWSFAQLADHARRLAAGLANAGLTPGACALLFAPNSPAWMITCLALVSLGAVPVLVDAQMNTEDLRHVLDDCEPQWIFATTQLAQRLQAVESWEDTPLTFLDAEEDDKRSWLNYVADHPRDFPAVQADDPAVLFYTSGTTGLPKGVPLTHSNLTANLHALLDLGLVNEDDRVLLPLPLHHVYPFTVGLLAPLAAGIPIVLPHSLTGPQILRALREGQVTSIIGVPRFYTALYEAVGAHARQWGRTAAALFFAALTVSVTVRQRLGLSLGRWLFAPLHRQFAPQLRVMASGGSALEPALAWKLEGLGWQVVSGYGLTETAPILTFNTPGANHLETAGKPLPGVEIRIDQPEQTGEPGEVLAKGPNVFAGYWHLPEETRTAFTDDGYFRTGDLGYFDESGYLHLVGRKSTLLILSGGENVRPEEIEDVLARGEHIREAGVLEDTDRLVALIVPETERLPQHDGEEVAARIRRDMEQQGHTLSSHHRITDYAITFDPLPRTRLGKIRRHTLTQRYHQAKQQGGQLHLEAGPVPITQLSPEDQELLENPTAQTTWNWLAQRFPDAHLTPDTNVQLDLGIDSLAWLNLTLEMQEHAGVDLSEDAIGRIKTVRNLLQEATEAEQTTNGRKDPLELLQQPEDLLSEQQRQWLQPPGPPMRALGSLLLSCNRLLLHWTCRLQVEGSEHLPEQGPFILTPNHVSLLDPPAIAAALPTRHLTRTYWGGWTGIMFTNPVMRLLSRAARVVPIDPQRGSLSSLAFATAALAKGYNLVWFPEGGRSHTGALQHFRPGVGLVVQAQRVPIIPVWISGSYETLPYGARWPRPHPIRVVFGQPVNPEELHRRGKGEHAHERIAAALYERVAALSKGI